MIDFEIFFRSASPDPGIATPQFTTKLRWDLFIDMIRLGVPRKLLLFCMNIKPYVRFSHYGTVPQVIRLVPVLVGTLGAGTHVVVARHWRRAGQGGGTG